MAIKTTDGVIHAMGLSLAYDAKERPTLCGLTVRDWEVARHNRLPTCPECLALRIEQELARDPLMPFSQTVTVQLNQPIEYIQLEFTLDGKTPGGL